MSVEAVNSAVMKREWVAISATAIKASAAQASALADHEKMVVAKGTRVTAVMEDNADQAYWIISEGVAGDTPIPETVRYLYKGHWELQPEAAPEAVPTPDPEPVPVVAPPPRPEPLRATPADTTPPSAPQPPVPPRRLFGLFTRGGRKKQ